MTLTRLLAAFAASLATAFPASATTQSTDYSDLWFMPAESGWGVNVIQQFDIVFATFFVYGADGTPRWFVAPDTRSVASAPGQNTFTGRLYSTSGTYFGSPWLSASNADVGAVTFAFATPTTGTVSYTVNGVAVTKAIVRQTWRNNVLTGNYIGGTTANGTNCRGVSNGPIAIVGELTIGHSNVFNPTFQVKFTSGGAPGTCTYTGGYSQEGRLGSVTNGTFSCQIQGNANPPAGTFTLTQIEATPMGLNARFIGSDQFCDYDGYFGGVRDVL